MISSDAFSVPHVICLIVIQKIFEGLVKVCENSRGEPQVPPLRFAPVGMTILFFLQEL
jgi:hypothetical protein